MNTLHSFLNKKLLTEMNWPLSNTGISKSPKWCTEQKCRPGRWSKCRPFRTKAALFRPLSMCSHTLFEVCRPFYHCQNFQWLFLVIDHEFDFLCNFLWILPFLPPPLWESAAPFWKCCPGVSCPHRQERLSNGGNEAQIFIIAILGGKYLFCHFGGKEIFLAF